MTSFSLPANPPPMADILLSCLHQDGERFPDTQLTKLTKQQWNSLAELAAEHRVVPLLYHRLTSDKAFKTPENSAEALKSMQSYSRQVAKNNLLRYGELQNVLNRFRQKNIQVVLLKGIYLAEVIYGDPGLREMNDIDILVKTSNLSNAFQILSDLGYRSNPPIDAAEVPGFTARHHHLPPMIKESVATIEVHWNITSPDQSYTIDPEVVWREAQPVTISGKAAMTLSPEDLFLHLCVHTSYQHNFSFGLRPFVDIAEVVNQFGDHIDWDNLVKRAVRFRWDRGVFLAMSIACDFTGADIPNEALNRLKPNNYEESIIDTAKEQIFTKKAESNSISTPMIEFAEQRSIQKKFNVVLRRVFPSKKFMEYKYSIPSGSSILYIYYVIRFWRLCKLHAGNLLQLSRGDEKLSGIAERKQKLSDWVNNTLT